MVARKDDPPGGRARIDEFTVPIGCPGDLGVPCGNRAWVPETMFVYLVHRLAPKDRTKDQQLPLSVRWRCSLCGRIQMTKDLEDLDVPPTS